jgi:hypothetical protein
MAFFKKSLALCKVAENWRQNGGKVAEGRKIVVSLAATSV